MNPEELKKIGERISKRRRELNYTQEHVAERMDVSIQMISNLERGNKAIKIENLVKISEILGISTDYILFGVSNGRESGLGEKIGRLNGRDRQMIETLVDFCLEG